ncbi:MAG: Na(+)/H(+) antiporter subunit D [Thermoleophilia bacterium]
MPELPPAVPFLVIGLLIPLIPRRLQGPAFLTAPVLAFVLLLGLEDGDRHTATYLGYELTTLRVDRLSLAFGYVFALASLFSGIYALHVRQTGQNVAAALYIGSAAGAIFAGDLLTLTVFWELMALTSVYLIWARGGQVAFGAGVRYLLVHLFGGSLLLGGVLLHFGQTGSLAFEAFEGGAAAWLILLGFAVNAAIPPLHAWLADAYPEATVTGSVFMSAFTTKTAVYALARGFAGWDVLLWAGVVMALYGVVYAVLVNDIRRILAYHIISQVGYMVAGVGMGTALALNGVTAHAFAHIIYKGLLFMGAGAVLYATGKSRLTDLGGLGPRMKLTFGLYMIGAFSISGFPLFSGFVSKSMVIAAAEEGGIAAAALLLYLASVGTFLHTGLKLPYFTWMSKDSGLEPKPLPWNMYAGMGLMAAACIVIGVYPDLLYRVLPNPVDYEPYTAAHVVETMQLLLFTGLGFYVLIGQLAGKPVISLDTDWFYRKATAPARSLGVEAPAWAFGKVEDASWTLVRAAVAVGRNPLDYVPFSSWLRTIGTEGAHKQLLQSGRPYDPNQYRLPIGAAVFSLLVAFSVLLVWGFVRVI